ncbi:type 1 fimbrial protein [Buttiauxella sp. B2]|uniref:fimbrial protein n=1 Tax=Buttiauxella sp. B2 TaxID=2587812 RepID=UPI001120F3A5|nr:fimbrial protein [Buttiauxella sp. B2]TNV11211.1 type 1 fimbrial protein [Buttiauxella sp. B2]
MKSKLIIIITMMLTLLLAGNASAGDVNITISGQVVPGPCTTVNNGNSEVLVSFGAMNVYAIANGNGVWKDFSLTVSDCPEGIGNVSVKFSGTMDPNDSERWKNTAATHPASNVSIDLVYSPDSTQITDQTFLSVPVNSGVAVIPLRVRLYNAMGGIMPGNISAVIVASFTYQ